MFKKNMARSKGLLVTAGPHPLDGQTWRRYGGGVILSHVSMMGLQGREAEGPGKKRLASYIMAYTQQEARRE